jgi:hypothetical protein
LKGLRRRRVFPIVLTPGFPALVIAHDVWVEHHVGALVHQQRDGRYRLDPRRVIGWCL